MVDRDSETVIRAELPGVKKDDLEVTLSEHTVTIEAHTTREEKEEKEEYYRREKSRGDFQCTLTLPGVFLSGGQARHNSRVCTGPG